MEHSVYCLFICLSRSWPSSGRIGDMIPRPFTISTDEFIQGSGASLISIIEKRNISVQHLIEISKLCKWVTVLVYGKYKNASKGTAITLGFKQY